MSKIICAVFDSPARFIARFVPQAWQRDWAVEVDVEGSKFFDVTAIVSEMDETERGNLGEGGNELADRFRESPFAPKWVREWSGPYEIYVEEHYPNADTAAIQEAKQNAALSGPSLPITIREALVKNIAECAADRYRDQGAALIALLKSGHQGFEKMTNAELLAKYKEFYGDDFLEENNLEVNAFGDLRSR